MARIDSSNEVGPHGFAPIRRFLNRGRCRACYWPESEHPRESWSTARPLGEKCAPMVVEVSSRAPKPKPDDGHSTQETPARSPGSGVGMGDVAPVTTPPDPPQNAAISRERFASRPALTPLEADRVAALAFRILGAANDSSHAYPKCLGLRSCMDDASRIIHLTGRTLTT